VVASYSWNILRDVLEWPTRPVCIEDISDKLIEGSRRKNKNFIFLFGCMTWSLWLIRNNFVFNNVLITSPDASVFRTISFMQKWKILNKEKEQLWIADVIHKLKTRLSSSRTED
jgi:hypothetical protein